MPRYARVAVPFPLEPIDLLVDYEIPAELEGQVLPGCLIKAPFGRQKTWAMVFDVVDRPAIDPAKIKPFESVMLPLPAFDRPRLNFLAWLSRHYFYPIGAVCEAALPGPVRSGTARTLKMPTAKPSPGANAELRKTLNEAQRRAVDDIVALGAGTHLLWGVTGSGKTEVYLQAIHEKLRQGKGAIVLVPEISLTPQVTQRFEERFPGQVAIFHSGLKPAQLRKAWLETLVGNRKIAIGARSAIFAPVADLGIVIVDEEHDGSYKQDDRLRYHARDAAIVLAGLYGVPAVLGSATPSAETLHSVATGATSRSALPERASESATLPRIEVVDLRKGIAEENKTPIIEVSDDFQTPVIKGDFFLTVELRAAMDETLAQGKQTILFLNRRGLGSQEVCRRCGHTPACPNCDVNLSPHAKGLLCHYCAYEIPASSDCADCGATDHPFVQVGVGTEAVEKAVEFHFPRARLLRLDRDTTTTQADYEEVLGRFARKEADVLVGTQMVAKGHDFPDVTLVGILLAEMGLAVPDYRANERCLQLLLQVSGRAGRALHPGRVILQTFQPDHPVFESLLRQKSLEDYGAFIGEELAKRQLLRYPPHGRLVLLRFDGLDSGEVAKAAETVGQALRKIRAPGLQTLGPVPSPLKKLRGRYRFQILLKSSTVEDGRKALTWILDGWASQKLERKFRTRLVVDVDPINML